MKKVWVVVISLLSLTFLALGGLFFIGYFKPKPGGISVTTNPASNVFVNGDLVGKTPYEGTFKAGEVIVKLVPEASDKNYLPFEIQTTLVAGIKTVIRRDFGETEESSAGEVVSFEKEVGKLSSVVVISTPDNTQVSIDGTPKGFTPYKLGNLTPGEHQISIKAVGYLERVLNVKTLPGFRLAIVANLAKDIQAEEQVAGEEVEIKTMVEILETPTGFLRVRTEPGSKGTEIHQVTTGEKYAFLEEDSETGWFKIQVQDAAPGLPDGIVGWVSNEYSKKVDEEVLPTDNSNDTI